MRVHQHTKVNVAVKFFLGPIAKSWRLDSQRRRCFAVQNLREIGLVDGDSRGQMWSGLPIFQENFDIFAVMRHGIHEMGFATKMSCVIQDYDLESSINKSEQGR